MFSFELMQYPNTPHLRQDILVEMCLHRRHFHTKDTLALRRQGRQDIALQPTQHQRFKLLVKLFDLDFMIYIVEVELVRELDCSFRWR